MPFAVNYHLPYMLLAVARAYNNGTATGIRSLEYYLRRNDYETKINQRYRIANAKGVG